MLVQDFLEESASRRPHKTAIIHNDLRLTYAEINDRANTLANALIAEGIAKGDRIAIFMENSIETVIVTFAVLKANAVFSMIGPTTKAEKLAYMLNNSDASALFCDVPRLREAQAAAGLSQNLRLIICTPALPAGAETINLRTLSYDDMIEGPSSTPPPSLSIDIDLAAIVYTSGSTGTPKGVMATHLNMVTVATSVNQYLRHTEDDIVLNVLPLSFGYGLYQLFTIFKACGTLVLEKSFAFPYRVIELIGKEKVTGFAGVPTIFAILLQLKNLHKLPLGSLRYLTNAGGALPVTHILRLREVFPQTEIYSMYGLTECQRASYLEPSELDRRPGSVGRGIPNTETYLVDEKGNSPLPGEVGELVVRGSHVTRGYWKSPEETALKFRPGSLPGETILYTGDLFRMDEEGYLYFVSRKDDIIKTRGEKVSPKEVENTLYTLDAVTEAAVVGVPDSILGEVVKAVIVLRDNAQISEREIMAHCARHLEDFMVPKIVEFRTELPKTGAGKIDKMELRQGIVLR